METRRTNQFLRFALGVRSPDGKKNYFKSKLFTAPEETKLKINMGNSSAGGDENSRTMYNMQSQNKTNASFGNIKNHQYNNRAKTSYGKW